LSRQANLGTLDSTSQLTVRLRQHAIAGPIITESDVS